MPKDTPGASSLPEGKAKVRLERDGSVLIVDEACTEPANPISQVWTFFSLFILIFYSAVLYLVSIQLTHLLFLCVQSLK